MKPCFLPLLLCSALVCHVALAAEEASPWGISTSASGMGSLGEWMPKLREAGITQARLFPEWRNIEQRPGEWSWAPTDELVRTAGENKFRINGIFMGAAPGGKGKPHAFPMNDLAGWSTFVSNCVARYKDRVRYWEVWNEGNGGFNDEHNTTADYARLAAATYTAAKQADPGAQIGLTTASYDPAYLYHAILAQKEQGTPGHFDFLCVHPYELADNVGHPDGEVPFLWMSRLLRDALRQSAPEKANADLWITEIGRNLARAKDQPAAEHGAAAALVKLYVMSLAQEIRCVEWFEAQDPAREEPGFGLLKRDGTPRASFQAFRAMLAALGAAPKYLGWLALGEGGRSFGFVFQNQNTPVLVAWKAAGDADQRLTFPAAVQTTSLADVSTATLPASQPLALGDDPALVSGLPPALVAQAVANRPKNFPWGGDYSAAKTVSVQLGADAPGAGVYQTGAHNLPKVTFPDGTPGLLVGANQNTQFYVHPSFASLLAHDYYVRLTVRRVTPGNVGMNLFYEVADTQGHVPYRNVGQWFSLGNGDGWQTCTWHVKDACFAKMWGHDLSFRPEQSQRFAIGKVEVSKEPF